jgi:hypothetical protein
MNKSRCASFGSNPITVWMNKSRCASFGSNPITVWMNNRAMIIAETSCLNGPAGLLRQLFYTSSNKQERKQYRRKRIWI